MERHLQISHVTYFIVNYEASLVMKNKFVHLMSQIFIVM